LSLKTHQPYYFYSFIWFERSLCCSWWEDRQFFIKFDGICCSICSIEGISKINKGLLVWWRIGWFYSYQSWMPQDFHWTVTGSYTWAERTNIYTKLLALCFALKKNWECEVDFSLLNRKAMVISWIWLKFEL
jgi:hypothetical protein